MNYFSQEDLNLFRNELLTSRANLLSELLEEQSTLAEVHSYVEDLGEMAFENTDKDIINALSGQQQKTLKQINIALEKIDNGTYGICTMCGKPIEKDRLSLLPFTVLCAEHKDSN